VATELVGGVTLDQLIARDGPLPVGRVASMGLDLLDALEATHAAGLAHLDLRPANVLIPADGHTRLTGVGLATLRTAPGADRATTAFLGPEQVRGDSTGPPPTSGPWGPSCSLQLRVRVHSAAGGGAPLRTGGTPPWRPSSTNGPARLSSPAPSPRPSPPS
jgi:serine/threonine protein kinase